MTLPATPDSDPAALSDEELNTAIAKALKIPVDDFCTDQNKVCLAEVKLNVDQQGEYLYRVSNIVHRENGNKVSMFFAKAHQKARALHETLYIKTGTSKNKKK